MMKTIIFLLILNLLSMINTAVADTWPEYKKLTGSWKSSMLMHRFKFASRIELELWVSDKGELEGAAMLTKDKKHCLGSVKMNRASNKLVFTAMEGSLCQISKAGAFELFRFMEEKERLGMRYVPSEVKNESKATLYSSNYYIRTSDYSNTFTDFVSLLKKNSETYYQGKQDRINEQEQFVRQAQDRVNQSSRFKVSGSSLIGIWQGQFINKDRTYPAEIMFWSSTPYQYTEVVGIVRFDSIPYKKNLCTTGIITHKTESNVRIFINYMNLQKDHSCIPLMVSGLVSLSDNDQSLTIFLDGELPRHVGQKGKHFKDFTFPGTEDKCYTIGMFQRENASEQLKAGFSKIIWKKVNEPTDMEKHILLNEISRLEELKSAHTLAVSGNATIRNEIAAEKEALKQKNIRKEQERIAAVRAKKKAEVERIQRNKMVLSQNKPYGGVATTETISYPVIHGPFDGLHAGSFLNALYLADWSVIKRFNKAYASRKMQQNRRIMGNSPHWSNGFIDEAFNAIQLTNTVLSVYLFDYGQVYGSCLKNDAVIFEVVDIVPDVVTRNLLGNEVTRSFGYTSHRNFKINKAFTQEFRRVGRTKPEGVMSTLSDFILNQGGTDLRRELIKGTREMMRKFSCDSKEIKQIELNLHKAVR